MSVWYILFAFMGLISFAVGFLWRLGYELRCIRNLLARARYISVFQYQVILESTFWKVSHRGSDTEVSVSGAYPTVISFYPFSVRVVELEILFTDERENISNYSTMDTSNKHGSHHQLYRLLIDLVQWVTSKLRPMIHFLSVRTTYKYGIEVIETKGKSVALNILSRTLQCDRVQVLLSKEGSDWTNMIIDACPVSVIQIGGNAIEVSTDRVNLQYRELEQLQYWLNEWLLGDSPIADHPTSHLKGLTKLNIVVHQSVNYCCEFMNDKIVLDGSLTGGGVYASTEIDLYSLRIQSISAHNIVKSKQSLKFGAKLSFNNVLLWGLQINDLSAIFDWIDIITTTVRCKSIIVSLGTEDRDKVIEFRSLSVSVKNHLAAFSFGQVSVDASPRILSKLVRVYFKLSNIFILAPLKDDRGLSTTISTEASDSGLLNSSSMNSSHNNLSQLVSGFSVLPKSPLIADINYKLMERKYLAGATPTTRSNSVSEQLSRTSSGMLSFDATPVGRRAAKPNHSAGNWRSEERITKRKKKQESVHTYRNNVLKISIHSVHIYNENQLHLRLRNIAVTSKTSSLGNPFTSITCEHLQVNENITYNGAGSSSSGFRFWIDGHFSGVHSKVFCLIPPVQVRLDKQFAAAVESYFLHVVDALKPPFSTTNSFLGGNAASHDSTKKVIEFLQVSSMQLELHAKEMLGVLSLDKAMINLNKSSVHKSHGFADAMNSLASQYKEEIAGQWLNLVMHLDVSIGRPVSTAKKLLEGITNLYKFQRD